MQKILLFIILVLPFGLLAQDNTVSNPYRDYFEAAYQAQPTVPRGILESVSYTTTRVKQHSVEQAQSCTGMPLALSVMGLVADGQGYFRNNLQLVAELSGFPADQIINDPETCIMAYANAYGILKQQLNITSMEPEDQVPVLSALSELPDHDLQTNFALSSHLYGVFTTMSSSQLQASLGIPVREVNLVRIFGEENLKILSSTYVTVTDEKIFDNKGNIFKKKKSYHKQVDFPTPKSSDYGAALWNPAASCNYSTSRGASISAVVIHDVEGSYAGCISWFQNCAASVSAHYVVRSSDGQITQMVLEAYKAWHVGSHNTYTIGIEHEGYRNQTGWYTTAMYTASANLVKDICNSGYGISPTTCYNGPSCNDICTLSASIKIKGHQHYSGQSHNDPGPNWNWYTYYSLVNNSTPPPPPTPPANDNCSAAQALTSNTSCVNTSGTLLNATAGGLVKATCDVSSSSTLKDVWYKFTAVSTTQTIKLTPSSGLDGVLALYGSCTGTQLGCSDNGGGPGGTETIVKSGLIIGTVYYVRVYSYGPNAPSTSTFSICVSGTPPSPSTTVQVGNSTAAYSAHPFSTVWMDERTQYIVTKAELQAAGWNAAQSYIKSLAIQVSTAAAQSMNGFTITLAHTSLASFTTTSFQAGTNAQAVYSGTSTAVAGWNTYNFSSAFAYNGTSNLLITICWNNSSYTSNSTVLATSYAGFMGLYYRADLASAGVCSQGTGTQTYYRPNMKMAFYSTSNKTDETSGDNLVIEEEKPVFEIYPNPNNGQFILSVNSFSEQELEIKGFDELGQLVYDELAGTVSGQVNREINISNLSSGIYYFRIRLGSELVNKKVVLKR